MKYMIRDLQFDCKYFGNGEIFYSKKEILEQLASYYHDIDYTGFKDNDEPYEDIYEFLDTLKDDDERLNWLLEYGQWEIEEVK